MMNLTPEIIAKGTGSSLENAKKFQPYLNKYLAKYKINTPTRVMAFLAQIGVESASLKATEEYASGAAYEGRDDLGNVYAGDGIKFKGRGLIQVTGRANYKGVQDHFGWKVVDNPELLAQPDKATEVSAWWWSQRKKNGKYLSEWADGIDPKQSIYDGNNKNIFTTITKGINGGTNGLDARLKNYAQVESEYTKIKRLLSQWFTKWWGVTIIATVFFGGIVIMYRELK
jgi:putative chitinase